MCIKKFLCFMPPRVGCLVLAYVGIVTSIAVLIYYTIMSNDVFHEYAAAVKKNSFRLEYEPGEEHLSPEEEKMAYALAVGWVVVVLASYFFVHGLFIIFSIVLAVGAHQNKRGAVHTYFIYGIFHFFFMLFLASLHFYMDEYLETAVIVCVDVLFAFCLCGVKGMLDSIKSGQIYAHPGPACKN